HVELRDRRPVAVGLDAFADLLVGQHVDVGELHIKIRQQAAGLGREAALRHAGLALHEQHDAVGLQQRFDARTQGGIKGHGGTRKAGVTRDSFYAAWHDAAMTTPHTQHPVPRHPHAWIGWVVASQLLVVLLWWRLGWHWGVPALLLSHALFVVPVFLPWSGFYGPALVRLADVGQAVWLTIDDGPSDDTVPILDLLDRHGARATFFLVGARAQARPELVQEILRRGHGIGNHSHTHPQAHFWRLGPRAMARE